MADEMIRLSYSDLSDRLGISPDAARMRAKRSAKKGRWKIIPGNHPSDRVLVELPADDLTASERVGGVRGERVLGERTLSQKEANNLVAMALENLVAAQAKIEALTAQLLAERDRHNQTAIELAQTETREAGMIAELVRLQAELAALREPWWKRLGRR